MLCSRFTCSSLAVLADPPPPLSTRAAGASCCAERQSVCGEPLVCFFVYLFLIFSFAFLERAAVQSGKVYAVSLLFILFFLIFSFALLERAAMQSGKVYAVSLFFFLPCAVVDEQQGVGGKLLCVCVCVCV